MEVKEITQEDCNKWNDYVMNHPDGTFYHLIGWKNVVEKTYGHKSYYYMVLDDKQIEGILPLFLIKSKLFGTKLVSLPFANYGGILTDNAEAEKLLVNKSKEVFKELNADYLEFRYLSEHNIEITNKIYNTFILQLTLNPEELWNKFDKKVRNSTRNAIKSNLKFKIGPKYINDFYRIYSKNMKEKGTPTHSFNFFRNIQNHLNTNVSVVLYEDRVIASLFLLFYKNTVTAGWGSSLSEYLKFSPNNLLYWESIKYACGNNYKFFDFGRSRENVGTYDFKKKWNPEQKQLYYQYFLNENKEMPDTSQLNPKRKIFSKVWLSLPNIMTNLLGPKIRKNMP